MFDSGQLVFNFVNLGKAFLGWMFDVSSLEANDRVFEFDQE